MPRQAILIAALLLPLTAHAQEGPKKPASPQRIRVAVLPFRFPTERVTKHQDGSTSWTVNDGPETRLFVPKLTSALLRFGPFDMIDAAHINAALRAHGFKSSPDSDTVHPKLNKALGADWLVYGVITDWSVHKRVEKIPFTSRFQAVNMASITTDLRIINAHNGRVMLSQSVMESKRWNAIQNSDSLDRPSIEPLREVRREHVNKIARLLYDHLDPPQIVNISSMGTYINRGRNHGLKLGERFRIVRPGPEIIDQRTGEVLDQETIEVGEARVVKVLGRSAKITITGKSAQLRDQLVPVPATVTEVNPRKRPPW